MKPIILPGKAAFSPFRLCALRDSMRALAPQAGIAGVEAIFVYALACDGEPPARELKRAAELLDAAGTEALEDDPRTFYVTPRKGTISPWSSKATDIFRNCSLTRFQRVERGIRFAVTRADGSRIPPEDAACAAGALFDRMTEGAYRDISDIFDTPPPKPGRSFDVLSRGVDAIREANASLGLAISEPEMEYLAKSFAAAGRNPTDTELVMFGQVNSEHCRHKIFGAEFTIDGRKMPESLFGMIKNTHALRPQGTLVAYKDNSSVVAGFDVESFWPDAKHTYRFREAKTDQLMKVETHNHPTAISPYPGAATGVGGEIRDESATGTGSRSVAGICGFMVSDLHLPGFPRPWETERTEFPGRLATPLQIMLEGPIGGAAFGNEFGRPQLTGFFRTWEATVDGEYRGYHKPVMLAGGMGTIFRDQVRKRKVTPGALVVQIGGPAMRIGLGGGAASSMMTGTNDEALDFDSVQRGNAEMQRRCQGVINACAAMGADNPILSIHDIGAGGLSNGCPELVEETGGKFDLRAVHNEEPSMSPMEIWCCEAQERYVLALKPQARKAFEELCARERCPVAFIGTATGDRRLVLEDAHFGDRPIDMDIGVLLGKPPRMVRRVGRVKRRPARLDLAGVKPQDALFRLLELPCIADKTFLVAIADRSVTGLVARDQMAGPYQLPVSDCAVSAMGYKTLKGQAMSTGERPPVAVYDGPASGRLAVAEAITNIAAADCGRIGNIRLSANWMAPCGEPGEDAVLYDTVKALGKEFCPALGVSIPVGKDSCSMHTVWTGSDGGRRSQSAPLSLVASAFSPVDDVTLTLTPDLKPGDSTVLLAVDLSGGKNRLGASALAQVYGQTGGEPADADAAALKAFFGAMQKIVKGRLALAYHDRSDGGFAVTLAEMAIAGGRGLSARLPGGDALSALFSEEPGAVLQVERARLARVKAIFARAGLEDAVCEIGAPARDRSFTLSAGWRTAVRTDVTALRRAWSETTYRMQALRDNPETARQEYDMALDETDPGMTYKLTFDPEAAPAQPRRAKGGKRGRRARPRVAILREQGVNGHVEMAAAFALAGFEAVDVHMTDLHAGRASLEDFAGLVACGGFSYGDVLGAGSGWARSILFNPALSRMFADFFARPDTFSLGVCNGCQMLSQLKGLIPGARRWPAFRRNLSEQFEARLATVEILESPSIFFRGMEGSRLPIPVAHGEGRVEFASARDAAKAAAAARYVDGRGAPAETYPLNPNGSAGGLTAFTSDDGRATIMMPHPERGFRACQISYNPGTFAGEAGPWMRMFRNAYAFATA